MITANTLLHFDAATAYVDGTLRVASPFKITADIESLTGAPEFWSRHQSCRASTTFGKIDSAEAGPQTGKASPCPTGTDMRSSSNQNTQNFAVPTMRNVGG
jgi:hypothetical protein